jgi:hypothetical protein
VANAAENSAAAMSVRDESMVNPPLRVIINALPGRVRKFIVFPFWFGYDHRTYEKRQFERGETKECHTW